MDWLGVFGFTVSSLDHMSCGVHCCVCCTADTSSVQGSVWHRKGQGAYPGVTLCQQVGAASLSVVARRKERPRNIRKLVMCAG